MHYEAFQPDSSLRPYVRSLYFFRGDAGVPGTSHTFCFPSDGGPELILNLGDPFAAGCCEARLRTFSNASIIGPLSCRLMTQTSGLTAFLAVRFRPGGLAPFFDVPPGELTDLSAGIDTFWGPFGRHTQQQVQDARTPAAAAAIVQEALCIKRSHAFIPDRPMSRAIDTIFASCGRVRVGLLARTIELSRRQFERRFKQWVGLSPKRLCRIVRFATVFSMIDRHHPRDWAQTAATCGYSDQAHLIRDCRFFTGHSPESYLKHRSPLEDAIFGSPPAVSYLFNTPPATSAIMPPRLSI